MIGPIVGSLAAPVVDKLAGGVMDMFTTQQASNARKDETAFAAEKALEQMAAETQNEQERAKFNDALSAVREKRIGQMGNQAANANTARAMAMDTTQNLNRMYATQGERLNQAAANTQNALNNAAATVAGMFR